MPPVEDDLTIQALDLNSGWGWRTGKIEIDIVRELGKGIVPVRKPGKLPGETLSTDYELEYGTNTMEIHADGVKKGQKVLIIDDLLATGGTLGASAKLVEMAGGIVSQIGVIIELSFLDGRKNLAGYDVYSMIQY
ncbi:MAG: adenine phosphoribosyltransferase [Proteobacteria bacterium]|nr:adenine phosphoribosyltransferase [Pseudomonadota bacterium]